MTACTRIALSLALAVLIGPSLVGCLKLEQGVTLMPDGSGRMTVVVAFNKKALEDLVPKGEGMEEEEKKEKDPFDDMGMGDPEKMEKDVEGIVAWTEPKKSEENGWITMTMTGYFEDINKVKFYESKPSMDEGGMDGPPPERKVTLSFDYKVGDPNTLIVKDETTKEVKKTAPAGDEEMDEAAREMAEKMKEIMKPLLKGMKISISISVPGAITSSDGYSSTDGRTATVLIDEQLLLDAMEGKAEAKKKLEGLKAERKLTWAKSDVTDAEVEAFRKELKKAKEDWKVLREDLKKKASQKREK